MISNILRAAEINALVERVKCDYLAINTQDRHSRVVCNGSIVYNLDIVNSNTSLDNQCIVLADASVGNIELQLPDATIATNRVYVIIKIDSTSNSVTCVPVSGQYINGLTSISLNTQYTWLELVNDSSNWWVIQSYSQVGGSPTPHFTINLVPTSITSPPNRSTNLTLTITPYNNFTGTVNLSLSGAPSGVSISPSSVNVTGSSPIVYTITLTIGNVAPNTYNIVFNAISGGIHVYANLSLTVQQYGLGSDYGYVCGGWYGNIAFSIIDRFQFPFDSGTASYVGNSSGSGVGNANNSSTHGYVCGGWMGGSDFLSTIDRFQFPFDSGTANHVGNLSGSKGVLSANNSSTHGYVCGGRNGNSSSYYYYNLFTIDRFQFPFDSGTANYVGNLSGSRCFLSANNSSTHGYVCGGWDGNIAFSTIDRFQFPFNSGTANYVGNLSGSKGALSANNSSIYGYVCGGWNYSWFSTVDRFQFPFDSGIASKIGNLSKNKGVGTNNSSTHGYACGGDNSDTWYSTIDRFQFPFNSGVASQVGNLSRSRSSSAADGVDFVTMFV